MIFHSIEFLIFFVLLIAVYWRISFKSQNWLLLAGSYLFYGFVHPWFLTLIVWSTLVDFTCAKAIERHSDLKIRRRYLIISIAGNLLTLGIFKYFNFFAENFIFISNVLGLSLDPLFLQIVLPVGISFYTFQSMGYTIDVWRKEIPAEKNLLTFAVYVAYFPQLVAGPIERAKHLLPQFNSTRTRKINDFESSIMLIAWGFFKKLVIADNVAVISYKLLALNSPSFPMLWTGVFAFTVQILADFSAYTDIARGVSRLLGIELMKNFNHPYFATNPADFWKRWHISLSQWFRDYVYIPLGGNRTSVYRNLMITFLLSGFWHGASWNFILWGGYWGVLLCAWHWLVVQKVPIRIPKPAAVACTFFLTMLGWMFFREPELDRIFANLVLSPFSVPAGDWSASLFLLSTVAIYSLPLWLHGLFVNIIENKKLFFRPAAAWSVATGLYLLILIAHSEVSTDFIYFQF